MLSSRFRGKFVFLISIFLLFLLVIGIYPGTGGEGAQRELAGLNRKTDWWNFATAALYGSWPAYFGHWEFTITVAQFAIYALGVYLISREITLKQNRLFLIAISYVGGIFVLQLWRDATLFALLTFSIGLLVRIKVLRKPFDYFRLITVVAICTAGLLFKPVFAPLYFLIFLFILRLFTFSKKKMTYLVLVTIILCLLPLSLDRQLSSIFHLKRSYPEQQVMIYDLSKLYCWGNSEDTIAISKNALMPLLTNTNGFEEICASLSPSGWDSLRVKNLEVTSSPALRIASEAEQVVRDVLISDWRRAILSSPYDWLMVKSSDLIQVLLMANSFYMPGIFVNPSSSVILQSGDYLIKSLQFPISLLDKVRAFTLGSSLVFGFVMVYLNRSSSGFSVRRERILFSFISINLATSAMGTLAFIANNGRYVLPFILLAYLYLIIAVDKAKIKLF